MKSKIQEKLTQLAFNRSIPFCYGCYCEAPTGTCRHCGSDDLMRLLPSVGCEYGTDWVIESMLSSELTPVDLAEEFEEHMHACYDETTRVGFMTLDTVSVMKEMDPVCWGIAQSEWESQEAEEGNIISVDNGSTYYRKDDVEELIERS